jgi:arginyl-tRNA synthetase
LRKAKKLQIENFKLKIEKLKKEEMDILREIYKLPEIIQEAAEKFSPNLICNFVFDLAKKYNLFYDLYPILKAENEETKNFRLILTKSVAQIIKNSLSLLGISVPQKM